MRASLLPLLLLLTQFGWSQEAYRLFQPNVQYVYRHELPDSPGTSPLLGMFLDDSPCQTTYESVQPNMPDGDWLCLTRVPAFIGSEVCREGGLTRLNVSDDESPLWLELQTEAPLGNLWLAALTPDSVFARVDDIYQGEFLSLTDSIKAIGFYRKNEMGQLTPLYEEAPLLVSKNYGLVRAVFLHWLGAEVGPIELAGMSEPAVGLQNPTRLTTINLIAGDELHSKTSYTGYTPEDEFIVDYKDERAVFVERFWTGENDTINLVFSVDHQTYFSLGGGPLRDTVYTPPYLDTMTYEWALLSFLDEQPGALIPDPVDDDIWRTVMLGYNYRCDRPAKQWSTEIGFWSEDCGETSIDALLGVAYYRGFYGPYFDYVYVGGFYFDIRRLAYAALSDGTICGEPLDFLSSTDELILEGAITTWPNPVKELLWWGIPDNQETLMVNIINAQGQVLTFDSTGPNQALDVSSLPPGVYWLQLIDQKGKTHTTPPFIKQ